MIRNLALQHAATACIGETCLLCELGFLFDMLQKADGSICQATNMLKALSNHPEGLSSTIESTPADSCQPRNWGFWRRTRVVLP